MPRVIQLTDLHLRARLTAQVRGVPVWATLRAALAEAERLAPDLLVLTGDLADDAKQYSYRELREALHDWTDRLRILPGNHDNRELLRATFRLGRSTLGFADRLGGWHLIGIDTVTPKRNRAQFGAEQLDWLAAELADGHEPVVIFTHHPPVSVNTWWLDRDLARDVRQFQKILERTDRVRAVVSGHVHQEVTRRISNTDVFMTPSTAYQFRLGGWWPARMDNGRPGLRVLELSHDSFETRVVRLSA
jgi:3',5'-cyclic-AMP phosphodiesterase